MVAVKWRLKIETKSEGGLSFLSSAKKAGRNK